MSKCPPSLVFSPSTATFSNGRLVLQPPSQISTFPSKPHSHWFVSLADLSFNYSWPNTGSVYPYQSSSFSYIWVDGTTNVVLLPNDFYNASTLSAYLQQVMTTNGHYLTPTSSTSTSPNLYYLSLASNLAAGGRTVLTCVPVPSTMPSGYTYGTGTAPAWPLPTTPATPQFIIPGAAPGNGAPYTFSLLVGITPATYPSTPISTVYQYQGTLIPQNPVSAIQVVFDRALNFTQPGNNSLVYNVPITAAYGSTQREQAPVLRWVKMVNGTFESLTLWFVDPQGHSIPFQDSSIAATLCFEERESKQ